MLLQVSSYCKRDQADLWDSGRVESDQTCHIEYEGATLCSRMTCHWQVTVWDERGDSTTSKPALWTMGLLEPSDWQARWITHDSGIIQRDRDAIQGTDTQPGTPALFRKEFHVPGTDSSCDTLCHGSRGT